MLHWMIFEQVDWFDNVPYLLPSISCSRTLAVKRLGFCSSELLVVCLGLSECSAIPIIWLNVTVDIYSRYLSEDVIFIVLTYHWINQVFSFCVDNLVVHLSLISCFLPVNIVWYLYNIRRIFTKVHLIRDFLNVKTVSYTHLTLPTICSV